MAPNLSVVEPPAPLSHNPRGIVSPFAQMARTHGMSSMCDAMVAVALAGSIFFSIDPAAARWRVALYLVLTIAPFAVVTPLIGPAVDRIRGGRRLMIVLTVLGRAVLAAYGDHLAVRTSRGSLSCRVVAGRRGKLDEGSVAREAVLLVATGITEVQGREMTVRLSHALHVEEEWLRELFPAGFREEAGAVFDEGARRVVARRRVMFYDLVIEDKEGGEVSDDEAASLLAEHIVDGSLKLKRWDAKIERWVARVAFLAQSRPELEISPIGDDEKKLIVTQVCRKARSYREVKDREVWPVLRDWLSDPQSAALESYAPERIELANGVGAKVIYETGKDPSIALKVQQLYGVRETPTISDRAVQVQVLAPNQRPWQVTQDLKSFWESGYPRMKKDLAGRYPRHEWR